MATSPFGLKNRSFRRWDSNSHIPTNHQTNVKPYHKRFASAAALALLLLTGAQARTWTSADGGKTFEGELRSYNAAVGEAVGQAMVELLNRK